MSILVASGCPGDWVFWTNYDRQKYVLSSHRVQKLLYENNFICIQLLRRNTHVNICKILYHHTEINILMNFHVMILFHLPHKGVGKYSLH